MYEFIEGNLESLTPTHAVIECQGIGYLTHISLNTYESIKGNPRLRLFIDQVFKVENQNPVAIQLYGFSDPDERVMFRLLTSISGVGNNTALIMLSSLVPYTRHFERQRWTVKKHQRDRRKNCPTDRARIKR